MPFLLNGKTAKEERDARKSCRRCGELINWVKPSHMAKRSYCSTKCAYADRVETNPKRSRPCVVCGGRMDAGRRRYNCRGKTCSAKCGYTLRKSTKRPQKTCPVCGVSYFPGCGFAVKHCSRKCYLKTIGLRPALVEKTCLQCGCKFKRTAAAINRQKRHFCGRECSSKYQTGANHAMFRGDKDPNRGADWNKLAESIRKERGYKCGRCDKTQEENREKLSVDHIRPWRSFEDKALANAKDNLVPLCRKCHSHKTSRVERMWLRGDVQAYQAWVRSLSLPSAATFSARVTL